MGSRAKKKCKKAEPLRRIAEWQELDPDEMRRRVRARAGLARLKNSRRAVYRRGPLHSVRGIRKARRHSNWYGPPNGPICMCCLNRSTTNKHVGTKDIPLPWSFSGKTHEENVYECLNCGSNSIIPIHSRARLPRKTANRKKWREFFEDQCKHAIEMYLGQWPDDFMEKA